MLPWIVIVGVVVILAVVGGHGGARGPALDPASTSPAGAKALALLVGRLGTRVGIDDGPPAPGSGGTALVLDDRLDPAGDKQLVDWVRSGGTLVVADPGLVASFAAPARQPGAAGLVAPSGSSLLVPGCGSPGVIGVGAIQPGGGFALRLPAGRIGCFGVAGEAGGGYFMVAGPLGRGSLVLLGGPDLWTNARLGQADNSVLAANLLAPVPGGTLHWIVGPRAGSGHKSLLQLMPPRVKEALVQLVVAVVLLCLWRGRRLGRPVMETQPVELAGSELVVAVGNLLEQGRRLDDASGIIRSSLVRTIGDQLGVGSSLPPDVLADLISRRTGLDPTVILGALAGPAPPDEAGLVALARSSDMIRQELATVR